jgi:amino acid transporter
MAYAEMALMMPTAGSLSSYAEAAIGNFPAILLVFAGYVAPALFGLPVELILANGIIRDVLPLDVPASVRATVTGLDPNQPDRSWFGKKVQMYTEKAYTSKQGDDIITYKYRPVGG